MSESTVRGTLGTIVLVIIVVGVAGAARDCAIGEIEGTVKFDDCRTTITVKPDSFRASSRQYVCSTTKTADGQLMSATCAHVVLADNGSCTEVDLYTKATALKCPKETPWLGFDARCHAEYETGYVFAEGSSK